MKIYKQEIIDGVADKVQACASIAYCAQAIISDNINDSSIDFIQKIKAESANPKQIDLYYLKAVLVSTGWNKNDDVFSSAQTWAARNTPEDKQFNFMHNENDIIGHITGSYVIDRNGKVIANDAIETPEEFDIITEAVLYNSWTSPENRERMDKIISEIKEGKWFVSMECLFSGFDYAITSTDGISRTIARDEDSSFLTKHLRAYGGTGEYEGYKIGRSLRDISFSGKGLVSRPANPRSIILDSSKAFSVNDNKDVNFVPTGDLNMSAEKEVEKQLDLPATASEVETATTQTETASEVEIETYTVKLSALEASLAEKESAIQNYVSQITTLEASVDNLQKELAAVSSEMQDMKKKEKDRMRKEKLMSSEFDESEAEEAMKLYDSLDDNAFEAIVAMYKKKAEKMKMEKKAESKEHKMDKEEDMEEKKMKEKESKASVDVESEEAQEELFDGVSSTEATLVDASDETDVIATTRKAVAEWLTKNLLNK